MTPNNTIKNLLDWNVASVVFSLASGPAIAGAAFGRDGLIFCSQFFIYFILCRAMVIRYEFEIAKVKIAKVLKEESHNGIYNVVEADKPQPVLDGLDVEAWMVSFVNNACDAKGIKPPLIVRKMSVEYSAYHSFIAVPDSGQEKKLSELRKKFLENPSDSLGIYIEYLQHHSPEFLFLSGPAQGWSATF